MKKILFSLIALFSVFIIQAQENTAHCSKRSKYVNTAKISPYINAAQQLQQNKYDVHFYQLNLNATNLSTAISGEVSIHASAKETIDYALLEFNSGFSISNLKVNNVETTYTRTGNLLQVPLDLPQGDHFVISINYAGTPPTAATNPLGGSGMTNATSPSWGKKVTWSLSEPFSAMEWFPVKQDLRDKADSVQVTVRVPENCMAGSNGKLDSITLESGFKTFHWYHRHPIAYYLISIAVSEYQEYNVYANPVGSTSPVLIQNFVYNNANYLTPQNQALIDETVDFIELFAEKFGPYPFQDEKYGHCLAPLSGGMEHQTMTTQGYFERGLTAHELAHQWWGNNVTCASWADIWINEGFASYAEYLMLENLYSFNAAQSNMTGVHNNVMSQNGGSTYVRDSLNESAIFSGRLTYDKGGAIVHTLRYLINDDVRFFNLLKSFQSTFADSTATGLDFKQFAENELNIDLTDFFDQWYYGEGYPIYKAQYQAIGSTVKVRMIQTTSRPSITPLFTNPIDIRITRSGGLGDTIVRLPISSNDELFTLENIDNFIAVQAIDPLNYVINKVESITNTPNVGLTNLDEVARLQLFPNPTTDKITVSFDGSATRTMTILDQRGRMIQTNRVQNGDTISIAHLSSGQYLIEFSDDSNLKVLRTVVKH